MFSQTYKATPSNASTSSLRSVSLASSANTLENLEALNSMTQNEVEQELRKNSQMLKDLKNRQELQHQQQTLNSIDLKGAKDHFYEKSEAQTRTEALQKQIETTQELKSIQGDEDEEEPVKAFKKSVHQSRA